jgi:hypothetical protein
MTIRFLRLITATLVESPPGQQRAALWQTKSAR